MKIEELIKKIESEEVNEEDKEALMKHLAKIIREINTISKNFLNK